MRGLNANLVIFLGGFNFVDIPRESDPHKNNLKQGELVHTGT